MSLYIVTGVIIQLLMDIFMVMYFIYHMKCMIKCNIYQLGLLVNLVQNIN